jgi:sec-independent protein translocase protein TatB
MFNLDPGKLLVIAVVAVILLGPDKLPQVARQAGAAWKTFNEFRHRMESEVRGSIPDLPSTAEIAHLARSPTALLNRLSAMGEPEAGTPDVAGTAASAGPATGDALADGVPIEHAPSTSPVSAAPATGAGAEAGPNGHANGVGAARYASRPANADVTSFGDPSLN